jgi:hypothetical protein
MKSNTFWALIASLILFDQIAWGELIRIDGNLYRGVDLINTETLDAESRQAQSACAEAQYQAQLACDKVQVIQDEVDNVALMESTGANTLQEARDQASSNPGVQAPPIEVDPENYGS